MSTTHRLRDTPTPEVLTRRGARYYVSSWKYCNHNPLTVLVGGFVMYGVSMSIAMLDAETVDEIDEALRHLSLVPASNRGVAWQAFADALLERRTRLENA